jgi:hypothetical protein
MLTTDRLLRVLRCAAVGALIGLGVGLFAASSFGASAPWACTGAAALVGGGGGAGYEWAQRGRAVLWGAATLVFALLWGALLMLSVKAGVGAPPLVSAAMPLGVLGLGVLAWALLAGRTSALAQVARSFFPGAVELPLGALSGGVFGLGSGLLFTLTYVSPPCGRFLDCIDLGFESELSVILFGAIIGGLACGVILAFALTIGGRLPPVEATRG